jgi:hypothetical protein
MVENTEGDFDWLDDGDSESSLKRPATDGKIPDYKPPSHEYPPDALFEGVFPISFTATVALLAVLAAVASVVRVGFPETGIPYNYPLFAGVVYVVAVLIVLRRFHAIFDETKRNLANVLERTEADKVIFDREHDIDAPELVEEFEATMDWAFRPWYIFLGGLVGGVFTLVVMGALDVFDSYPYIFLNYAYGAGHGFFYPPLFGSVVLVHRISNDYIIDVDILAPDGVGGYRGIGEAIVNLIVYGISLVTLDFVILSSVSFLDRPMFRIAAFAVYGLMLGALLVLTFYGVMSLRRGLLTIRERKVDAMREQFKTMEVNYWQKLDRYESPEPEATHIETMNTMFEKLQSMALWPINLAAFAKLFVSVLGSLAIAALKTWLTTGEVPAVVSWLLF